jgi:hypothetical protein
MSETSHNQREAHCDLEIWTRAKCGLRVRSRGRLELGALMELTMEERGKAVSALIFKAAAEIAAEVEKMDKQWDDARKPTDHGN